MLIGLSRLCATVNIHKRATRFPYFNISLVTAWHRQSDRGGLLLSTQASGNTSTLIHVKGISRLGLHTQKRDYVDHYQRRPLFSFANASSTRGRHLGKRCSGGFRVLILPAFRANVLPYNKDGFDRTKQRLIQGNSERF